jgi:hypothetical protein
MKFYSIAFSLIAFVFCEPCFSKDPSASATQTTLGRIRSSCGNLLNSAARPVTAVFRPQTDPTPETSASLTQVAGNTIGAVVPLTSGKFLFLHDGHRSFPVIGGRSLLNAFDETKSASITTGRIEEKVVANMKSAGQFLQHTQTKEFAQAAELADPIRWTMRDRHPHGRTNVTFTVYGGMAELELAPKNKVGVKPRFRIYGTRAGEIDTTSDLHSFQPTTNGIVAFELKFVAKTGTPTDDMLSMPQEVFKPRIFLSQALAEKLFQINANQPDWQEQLSQVEASALSEQSAQPNHFQSSESAIRSQFAFVRQLLPQHPYFLSPAILVSYERTAYSARVAESSEYQFTVDRNIKTFEMDARNPFEFDQVVRFVTTQPTSFESSQDLAFAELKSPVFEKRNQSPTYLRLIQTLTEMHNPQFKINDGKYSNTHISIYRNRAERVQRTHFDNGTSFWLIKGTINLEKEPTSNDLLSRKQIDVAHAVVGLDGKTYQVRLRYGPIPTHQDQSKDDRVLERIEIRNEHGDKILNGDVFSNTVKSIVKMKDDKVYGLDVLGTIVPFPSRVGTEVIHEYEEFFKLYFKLKKDRKSQYQTFRDLDWIGTEKELATARRKMAVDNFRTQLRDRSFKQLLSGPANGALFLTGALVAYALLPESLRPENIHQTVAVASAEMSDKVDPRILKNAEVQYRFQPKDLPSLLARLGIDPQTGRTRQVVIFDSNQREMENAGVQLRLRTETELDAATGQPNQKNTLTVKVRGLDRMTVSALPVAILSNSEFKCESDQFPNENIDRVSCSLSKVLTNPDQIVQLGNGTLSVLDVLSTTQKTLLMTKIRDSHVSNVKIGAHRHSETFWDFKDVLSDYDNKMQLEHVHGSNFTQERVEVSIRTATGHSEKAQERMREILFSGTTANP